MRQIIKYPELSDEHIQKIKDVGGIFKNEFTSNEKLRQSKEREWLEDLRSTEGIYDPDVLAKIPENASTVFPKYTRSKEITLRSRINNIVLPEFEKNWTIKPTPKPKLSKEVLAQIYDTLSVLNQTKALQEAQQTGQPVKAEKVTQKQFEEEVIKYSTARCIKMEIEIEDQLMDIGYEEVTKKTVHSAVRYGTGIIRGVLSKKMKENGYQETLQGKFENVEVEKFLPDIKNVRVWDWYPDMAAQEPDDCSFAWERYVFPKHKVRELGKREDFFKDVIDDYLKTHSNGDAIYKDWELQLETITDDESQKTRHGKFEVFSRWGSVDGRTLKNVGFDIDDDNLDKEVWCNIWLLGDSVIKFIISPLAGDVTLPYHIFYFDKNESSIFGKGLPRILRDTQFIIGGSIRATLNNAARVAGAMLEVNTDLLDVGEDPEDVFPGRVWKRHGRQAEAQYQAVRPISFDSHITDLLMIFDKAMVIGDMEISVPMFMSSDRDQNATRKNNSELAMKWAATTLPIKDLIKNFDTMNESVLKSIYEWNMEYNPNDNIKGDFNVSAKGSVSLLTRELKMQALNVFAQTLTPEERIYFKTALFLRERAKAFDINPDEILYTEEEADAIRQSMRDQEAEQLQKDEMRAKIAERTERAKGITVKSDAIAKKADLDIVTSLTPEPKEEPGTLTKGE
jgi:hypothetical protein